MRWIVCALLLAVSLPARAQVSIELAFDQLQFLRDESLPVKVRITNRSGQTIKLADRPDWLGFQVEGREVLPVVQREDLAPQDEFSLESASVVTRRFDLKPLFALSRPDHYKVTATLRIKDWAQEVVSRPKTFDVITGFKVWEQEFGVPGAEGPPEVRKYLLQQANLHSANKAETRLLLYARLADQRDTHAFRVLPMGPLVSFARPEAQVDKGSNLHVLFQSGPRSFYYVVIGPHGDVLQRETHEYVGNSRPVLRGGENGSFLVTGGARRRAMDNLPASAPESSNGPVDKP